MLMSQRKALAWPQQDRALKASPSVHEQPALSMRWPLNPNGTYATVSLSIALVSFVKRVFVHLSCSLHMFSRTTSGTSLLVYKPRNFPRETGHVGWGGESDWRTGV